MTRVKHELKNPIKKTGTWTRRRSFLSSSMLNDEKHTVYEFFDSYRESKQTLSFSLSLKEAQGFCWNQDLFALEYQQRRAQKEDEDNEEVLEEVQVFEEGELPMKVVRRFSHRKSSAGGNERDGYGTVEVSEIFVGDETEQ